MSKFEKIIAFSTICVYINLCELKYVQIYIQITLLELNAMLAVIKMHLSINNNHRKNWKNVI